MTLSDVEWLSKIFNGALHGLSATAELLFCDQCIKTDAVSLIHQTQPKLLPKTEAFIRRSWYSLLPVLDTTGRRHVKKVVMWVAELVAALITVHGLLSFLPDVFGLFDPSGKTLCLCHCRSPLLETSWWHASLFMAIFTGRKLAQPWVGLPLSGNSLPGYPTE